MIYVYAIGEADGASSLLRGRGIGGAAVRTLRDHGLTAVYSRHRRLSVRPTAELVLAHERVVERAMEFGAVLPLRFGTQLGNEHDLMSVLAERRQELRQSLDRVRGRVEIGLRVLPAARRRSPGERSGRTGQEYLLRRVEERRRGEHATRNLHGPLESLAEASVVRRPRSPTMLAASYLVDVDRAAEFRKRAEELGAEQSGIRVFVTGPWPPYSFAAEARR